MLPVNRKWPSSGSMVGDRVPNPVLGLGDRYGFASRASIKKSRRCSRRKRSRRSRPHDAPITAFRTISRTGSVGWICFSAVPPQTPRASNQETRNTRLPSSVLQGLGHGIVEVAHPHHRHSIRAARRVRHPTAVWRNGCDAHLPASVGSIDRRTATMLHWLVRAPRATTRSRPRKRRRPAQPPAPALSCESHPAADGDRRTGTGTRSCECIRISRRTSGAAVKPLL